QLLRSFYHRALRHQGINPSIRGDMPDLIRLQEIIDRHHHRPGVEDSEIGPHKFRAILHPKPDAITLLHPKGSLKLSGHSLGVFVQRVVSNLLLAPKERLLAFVRRRGSSQCERQIHPRQYPLSACKLQSRNSLCPNRSLTVTALISNRAATVRERFGGLRQLPSHLFLGAANLSFNTSRMDQTESDADLIPAVLNGNT